MRATAINGGREREAHRKQSYVLLCRPVWLSKSMACLMRLSQENGVLVPILGVSGVPSGGSNPEEQPDDRSICWFKASSRDLISKERL